MPGWIRPGIAVTLADVVRKNNVQTVLVQSLRNRSALR